MTMDSPDGFTSEDASEKMAGFLGELIAFKEKNGHVNAPCINDDLSVNELGCWLARISDDVLRRGFKADHPGFCGALEALGVDFHVWDIQRLSEERNKHTDRAAIAVLAKSLHLDPPQPGDWASGHERLDPLRSQMRRKTKERINQLVGHFAKYGHFRVHHRDKAFKGLGAWLYLAIRREGAKEFKTPLAAKLIEIGAMKDVWAPSPAPVVSPALGDTGFLVDDEAVETVSEVPGPDSGSSRDTGFLDEEIPGLDFSAPVAPRESWRAGRDIDRVIAGRIQKRRLELDVSVPALAASLNMTEDAFIILESGVNRIDSSLLWALSERLDIPIGSLFAELTPPPPDRRVAGMPDLRLERERQGGGFEKTRYK